MDAESSFAGSQVSRRPSKRPRCAQCGSKRFRRDGGTGLVVCSEGHVLQGFREEEADDGAEWTNRSQVRKRTLRKQKRRRKAKALGARGIWRGARGDYRFYEALQLLLRIQIAALRHAWPDLPEEIEPVVRDLWAMLISTHPDLNPAPLDELSDKMGAVTMRASSVASGSRSRSRSRAQSIAQSQSDADEAAKREGRRRERREARRLRAQLAELGGQVSDSSGDEESDLESALTDSQGGSGEGSGTELEEREGSGKAARTPLAGAPNADTLVVLIYLGLVTLRVPVLWQDLRRLIEERTLPYLNAIHVLSAELVKPLNARAVAALDPQSIPRVSSLHERAVHVATRLSDSFGVRFPDLNAPPVLWRCVAEMLLPPPFYAATKALLGLLRVSMSPVPRSARVDIRLDPVEDRTRRHPGLDVAGPRSPSWARCVMQMAALVVVVKLRFGLDGEERFEDLHASHCAAPPLMLWLEALRGRDEELEMKAPDAFLREDVLDMSSNSIDDYLDWAEENLVLPNNPEMYHNRRRAEGILDLLDVQHPDEPVTTNEQWTADSSAPGGDQDASSSAGSEAHVRAAPVPSPLPLTSPTRSALERLYTAAPPEHQSRPASSETQLRPGESFPVLLSQRAEDGEIHPQLAAVVQSACCVVGSTRKEMLHAVARIETKLVTRLKGGG